MGRFIEPRVHWINICLIGRRAEDIARQKANAEGASVGGKVYLVRNTQNWKRLTRRTLDRTSLVHARQKCRERQGLSPLITAGY